MPLASAIFADINMRFSHYLMFSDSTQTHPAALQALMTHPGFKLRGIKNQQILSKWETCFSTRYDFYLLGRTSKMLQSLDVSMKWPIVDSKTLDFFTIMADSDGEVCNI